MKQMSNLFLTKSAKLALAVALAAGVFSACSKSSNTVNTGPVLPAQAIRGTTLTGGNIKGVMLSDSTYSVSGDLTVLPTDTLIIQPGATIKVTGNRAFLVQGTIMSLGTQAKPITFTTTGPSQPGQWGGIQADSCKGLTFQWTKLLWAGGADSTTGYPRATIDVRTPIHIDIEDCWFVGGQDNGITMFSKGSATILRNSFYGGGTTDGDCIDFHDGATGVCAYNVGWGQAGSGIKIFTNSSTPLVETDITAYNNTFVDIGFRRGAGEPGRGILVDAYAHGQVFNNIFANNYWSLDVTTTADFAKTTYGFNYFYATVDSLRQWMYPAGEKGMKQSTDVIDSVKLGANDPQFVGYTTPPNPSARIIPSSFDFHLKATSPALNKGTTTAFNLPAGIPAPPPSADMGAYVSDTSNGKGNRHAPGY